jgi:5-(carboxyamino)imidazole ribonucleotide synthase
MLSVAASRLGYRTHIYEPGAGACGRCGPCGDHRPYDDAAALRAFAESVDVITYEFENVPTAALDLLESIRPIRPNRRALAVSQDRLTEKDFWPARPDRALRNVETEADLPPARWPIGAPAILKTRRMGYDGKGQIRFSDPRSATGPARPRCWKASSISPPRSASSWRAAPMARSRPMIPA